ncbi:hypothetical protein K449DRAFT_151595 [Hypoxylon sp. EC38]|nr:hypothetical protein K449DRAFT_151595 [Hypoxylon sp. EC38]
MWERCDEARPPAGQDPDVVGLGTLIACAGSASIAVLCLVVQYLFFYLPQDEDEQSSANPIDVLLIIWLRKPFRCLGFRSSSLAASRQERRRWPAAFNQYVLALGDVQLAMGFAVLAYGYASLAEKGMSMYHWWLVVGVGYF